MSASRSLRPHEVLLRQVPGLIGREKVVAKNGPFR